MMSARTSYAEPLQNPQPCEHLIQLYTDEAFLGRAVREFLRPALTGGEGAVVIATPAHVAMFREQLCAGGVDVQAAERRAQLVVRDAQASLAEFMVDGMPDRDRFFGLVRPVLATLRRDGYSAVRLYGEMVDLLWNHSMPATVALEELWNEVRHEAGVSLLCAYRLDNFDRQLHRGVLHQLATCHSELIPVEDYAQLERAVSRAYRDAFGTAGDAEALRAHITKMSQGRTKMPEPQAALFGLGKLAPVLANLVIERARHHYSRS
jgi:hypothetical protein